MQDAERPSTQPRLEADLLVVPLADGRIVLVDIPDASVTVLEGTDLIYLHKHTNFAQSDVMLMCIQLAGKLSRDSEDAKAAAAISESVRGMSEAAGLPPGAIVPAFAGPSAFRIPVARGVR